MDKKYAIGIGIFVLVFLTFIIIVNSNDYSKDVPDNIKNTERTYDCDFHTVSLKTKISFNVDNEEYVVTGNFIRVVTDPLTLNKNGKKVGYAGDSYNFFKQDDHPIYIDDKFEVDVCGNFEVIGDSYELYDKNKNKVGYAKFNGFNTSGAIYNTNNEAIAVYSKKYFFNDYTIKIYDNNICSDKAILMIFASYVSDYHYDEQMRNSKNNNYHSGD